MLKGTFKYPVDSWTNKQWEAEEEDEAIDQINYKLLKDHAREARE